MDCLLNVNSGTPMPQLLNLTTNSFFLPGQSGRNALSVTAMAAPTVNLCLNRRPSSALPLSKAMLKRNIIIPQTSVCNSNHRKSFSQFVHKNLIIEGHRGPPCCMSIDVEKEDNSSVDVKANGSVDVESDINAVEAAANPRLGLEERFAVINTGKYECSSCGYVYDQALGDQVYPIAPGLEFSKLPEDWRCPTCGAAQSYFNSKSIEVAGFAQNQQFGLGGNSLTSGQKSGLIFGFLLFAFAFFLFGYFLQ